MVGLPARRVGGLRRRGKQIDDDQDIEDMIEDLMGAQRQVQACTGDNYT
jgi:hypothetical protein